MKWITLLQKRNFLSSEERAALCGIMRKRKGDGLEVRRANALLLLDEGKSTSFVARVLYLDAETVREWRRMFVANGMSWLPMSAYPERESRLGKRREGLLVKALRAEPAGSVKEVQSLVEKTCGVSYSRAGTIKLMHRLNFRLNRPQQLPKQADAETQ